MEDFNVGSVVKGKVTGIESYGIFVMLDNLRYGLIHISQITEKFVKDINNYAKIGETIYVEIIDIDNDNDRYVLSVKGLNYRIDNKKKIKESVRGFTPLKQRLPEWIEEKYALIHEKGN